MNYSQCRILFIAAISYCLASCSQYSISTDTASMPVHALIKEQAGSIPASGDIPQQWWLEFADPQLNSLVTRGLAHNQSLAATLARLEQSEALVKQQTAAQLPSANLSAGRQRRWQDQNAIATTTDSWQLGLAIHYEWDLRGKIKALSESAHYTFESQQAAVQLQANTVVAAIAKSWFSLISAQQTLNLLDAQKQRVDTALQVINKRNRLGAAPITDVWQQQQLLEQVNATLLSTSREFDLQRNILALWLGTTADSLEVTAPQTLSSAPTNVQSLPALSYIFQRPDVRQSWLELQATEKDLAAAIQDRWPQLDFSASYVGEAVHFHDLIEDWLASISLDVVVPLMDGGLRRAEVRRQQARVKESLAIYQEQLLGAAAELDNAFTAQQVQQQLLDNLQQRLALAKRSEIRLEQRYRRGDVDFLSLLDAQQTVIALEQNTLNANLQLHHFRIELLGAISNGLFYDPQATIVATSQPLSPPTRSLIE